MAGVYLENAPQRRSHGVERIIDRPSTIAIAQRNRVIIDLIMTGLE